MSVEFSPGAVSEAFDRGYHSERQPHTSHNQHLLHFDAVEIGNNLGLMQGDERIGTIRDALVHGNGAQFFDDALPALWHFSHECGDTIAIWTEGDTSRGIDQDKSIGTHAQVAKARQLGLEPLLTDPSDRGNLIIYSADGDYKGLGKAALLPTIANYSVKRRNNSTMAIIDDRVNNLRKAAQQLEHSDTQVDYHLFWLNRDGKEPENIPEGTIVVSDMNEYALAVDSLRLGNGTVTHVIDIDDTLISSPHSKEARRQAVTDTLLNGKKFEPIPKPGIHIVNGFAVIDGMSELPKMKVATLASHDFSGHQADIYESGGVLLKAYAAKDDHRPEEQNWADYGGFYGVQQLNTKLNEYRSRLRAVGFPVPTAEESTFLIGRKQTETGTRFFSVEAVKKLSEQNLQDELLQTDELEIKKQLIDLMLEASYPLLVTEGLSADLKPANWVRTERGPVHIDPLPFLMHDEETGLDTTEWPTIPNHELQPFLHKTHMTEQVIGFRFYQELCQMDPARRQFYQGVIMERLAAWNMGDKLSAESMGRIQEAMSPETSRILESVLKGTEEPDSGFSKIDKLLAQDKEKKEPLIYKLREMSFALSEHMLTHDIDQTGVVTRALDIVENRMGEKRGAIERALKDIPEDVQFLTVIRKLTHLSAHNGSSLDEETALEVIQHIAYEVASRSQS